MKLLLLYPPDKNLIDTGLPKILEEGVGFSPPLGIFYLASSVKQRTNWQVELIDCAAERLTFEQIQARIDEAKPDVLGVTVTTHQLMDCVEIAKIAKKLDPGIKVIFGGPHVHIYPKETMEHVFVDFVITGEAEFSIVDFLNSWNQPAKFGTIPGLYFKSPDGILSGPPPVIISNLDDLPYPARVISKYKLYTSPLVRAEMVTSMITSRGCPFQCIYCNRPNMGNQFRARSAKNVVDEMQECAEFGIKHIKIYDDTFTIERKRVFDICDEIRRRNLNISWDIRAHINTVDFEMLKQLKKSGCTLICYGVESGTDEMLKRIRKGVTRKKAAEVFSMTKKIGIQTLAYFMIGLPNETRKQMLETIEFARKINPDYCHFAILVPFPATPVYAEGMASGVLSNDYWMEFAKTPTEVFKPELWIENVSRVDMELLLLKAYKEFYMRPIYIARRIFEIRSFSEFKRKLQSGLCLICNSRGNKEKSIV